MRGEPVSMPTNSSTPPATKVLLGCSKCGATLPDDAEFCLKCGKSVSSPPKSAAVVEVLPPAQVPQPRKKRRLLLWLMPAVLILLILWALMSDNAGAQHFQELVGMKQDRVILDSTFSVGPHTFRYYKFALPEGSLNVAVVGQFNSAADSQTSGTHKAPVVDKKGTDSDNNIEVNILTESAFTVWQNGYATSSIYESGRVAEGTVQADVPAGAGIYYLVFNNKSAPNTPKTIRAAVVLRYKSWLPDWFRHMKGRLSDWLSSD
jgi:hypothetical protein